MAQIKKFTQVGLYPQFWDVPSCHYYPAEINTISQLNDGSFLFAGNRPNATTGQGEDARIIRTDNQFNPIDYMVIRHGGHGSGLGTKLNDDGSIDCFLVLPAIKSISQYYRLAKFKYQPNTVIDVTDNSIDTIKYFDSSTHMNNEAILSHDGTKIITIEHGENINQMTIDIWGYDGKYITDEPLYQIPFNNIHQGDYNNGINQNIYQGIGWSLDDSTIWIAFGYQLHEQQYDPSNIINVDYTTGDILSTYHVDKNDPQYNLSNGDAIEIEGITADVNGNGLFVIIIGEGSYWTDKTPETTRGHIYHVTTEDS